MPRRDGSGPDGAGPRTGRGNGTCTTTKPTTGRGRRTAPAKRPKRRVGKA